MSSSVVVVEEEEEARKESTHKTRQTNHLQNRSSSTKTTNYANSFFVIIVILWKGAAKVYIFFKYINRMWKLKIINQYWIFSTLWKLTKGWKRAASDWNKTRKKRFVKKVLRGWQRERERECDTSHPFGHRTKTDDNQPTTYKKESPSSYPRIEIIKDGF